MTKDIISKKKQQKWIFAALLIAATSSSLAYAAEDTGEEAFLSGVIGVLWPVFLGWIAAVVLAVRRHKISVILSSIGGLFLSGYLSWQHISGNDASACQEEEEGTG